VSTAPTELIVCRQCDTVHRQVILAQSEVACCAACGALIDRHHRLSTEQLLALTVAAAIMFVIAAANPLLVIEASGMRTEANVWTAALAMGHGWLAPAAAVLGVTTFFVPMAQILLLLWLLLFARAGYQAPGSRAVLVTLHRLRPWSLTEVFLLGALVAIVKLSSWVHVTPGTGIWALAALTLFLTVLSVVAPRVWWTLPEASA
jgi:paraquat-inducible protein A